MSDTTALIDASGRQSITGVLNTDGITIVRAEVNPSNHGLIVNDAGTGSDAGGGTAEIDANGRETWFVESSNNDGTLVAVYINASGEILVDSN